MLRNYLILSLGLAGIFPVSEVSAAGGERHVIVMVWDGMRPDFVTAEYAPTLHQLAQNGVWFENNHPVYVSTTEVNGTAIATGCYPEIDGIIGNREFRPEIDPVKSVHTEGIDVVRKGDEITGGKYIRVPTVAEILHAKGRKTAVAGAKPVALLHDRAQRGNSALGVTLFAGQTVPTDFLQTILPLHGAFPSATNANPTRNDWTAEALIDPLWKDGVPAFSLVWMSEPDFSQHQTGPGSARSLSAIKNADDNLARILRALDAKGVRDTTDIMIVSDHGFSTIASVVDVAGNLRSGGFNAVRDPKPKPDPGEIMVVSSGGSMLLYVAGHDQAVIKKLVAFLQRQSYPGVILARESFPGAFRLHDVHLDSPNAPDVVVSMRWMPDKNKNGAPGMIVFDAFDLGPSQGMHGTLGPSDMHNTLVAAGPDFRHGVVDHLPTGNVDVAPTALWILGEKKAVRKMNGRVLTEALSIPGPQIKSYEPRHLEASHDSGGVKWHQYLNYSEVNGVSYFEDGNGGQAEK